MWVVVEMTRVADRESQLIDTELESMYIQYVEAIEERYVYD